MAGAENKSGRKQTGRDADAIRRRLDALGEKLAEAQTRHGPAPALAPRSQGAALGQALRLGVELVAGVAVGVFIGWALDRLFGTAPFLMVTFLGLGRRGRNPQRGADRQAHAGGGAIGQGLAERGGRR